MSDKFSVLVTSYEALHNKKQCAYHTNGVLYGTVGVLITQ